MSLATYNDENKELFMSSRFVVIFILVLLILPGLNARGYTDQKDRDAQLKLALDELKNEVVVLERQVSAMKESYDRNSGQLNALITQIIDSVNAIRQAQSRVA